ncbi:enoyl-CoA delta isomerase 3-like [Ipomoea triloba]|uniref:enoyl-CoA delta isomerase 3-like n=1 Tax=Ipomoea triloba TaxID=35885 RepID=UPI00125E74D2|nr:enoyl-CoA delta isomerase 3-like [Ipomoea triloba]
MRVTLLFISDKCVLYMSELGMGLPLLDYYIAIIRSKVGFVAARQALVLKASKLKAVEALGLGLIDSAHANAEETVKATVHIAKTLAKQQWDSTNYADLRKLLLLDGCAVLKLTKTVVVHSCL